jgi:hypothetical protein
MGMLMAVDHVELLTEAARKAGADLSTVADHVERIDYLTPGEGEALTLALANVVEQAERALARVDAIEEAEACTLTLEAMSDGG